MKTVDLSIIIPTLNRRTILERTIESIAKQSIQPAEIIIVDSSKPFVSFEAEYYKKFPSLKSRITYIEAVNKGAAAQRNQGIEVSNFEVIGFFDDDIVLEPDCIQNLWLALMNDHTCGGVNGIMVNQMYHPLGRFSRILYNFISGETPETFAGRCIGPAINFLPDDRNPKSDISEVEWMNTGCTLYKKVALPSPVFDTFFEGYSLMEDLALSLKVGMKWKLLSISNAKLFHDSQKGDEKSNIAKFSEMDLANRFYIMKHILKKTKGKDLFHLFLHQFFHSIASRQIFNRFFWIGKIKAIKKIKTI